MPTLHVHLTGKPTRARQRALVSRLTDAVCRAVGKKPEDVTIYLYCHAGGAHDMAFAGVLHSERKTTGG
jgi:phenylpyruvate tautomerase PptA (4-oxalocrotonate tautomerase family)